MALVRELGAPVQYIVLPTTLVEHKIFVGPFARRFPAAEVYAVPGDDFSEVSTPGLSGAGLFRG